MSPTPKTISRTKPGGVARAAQRKDLDQWESDAVTIAAATHAVSFLHTLAQTKGDKPELSSTALKTSEIVVTHSRSRPTAEQMQTLLAGLENAQPALMEVVVRGLTSGWSREHRITVKAEAEGSLLKMLEAVPASSKGQLLKLSSLCGSKALESYAKEIAESLLKVVKNADAATPERINAAKEAVGFQSDNAEVVTSVLDTITLQTTPDLALGIIEAAGLSTSEALGEQLVQRSEQMTPQMKAAAIRVLLARPATTIALLKAVEARSMEIGDLTLDQKQALRAHPDKAIQGSSRSGETDGCRRRTARRRP